MSNKENPDQTPPLRKGPPASAGSFSIGQSYNPMLAGRGVTNVAAVFHRAVVANASAILMLQRLAYQSEAELYNDFTIPPLVQTVAQMEEDIKRQFVLIVAVEGRLAGSVRAHAKDGTCYIGRLIVHPDLQRRGLGTKLVAEIEYAFRSCKRYELFTGSKSTGNIKFYEKHGYTKFREERVSETMSLVFFQKPSKGEKTMPVTPMPLTKAGPVYSSAKGYFGVVKPQMRSEASIQEYESTKAREIAVGNYVLARTSVFEGYPVSSALLAEQSIEMYVKAVIKVRAKWNPEKMEKEHNPIALMMMVPEFPEFVKILSGKEQKKFLQELNDVYSTMRFGEAAISGVDSRKFTAMLDSLAFTFESIFVGNANTQNIRVYVHEDLREAFLLENSYFKPEMLSDNHVANSISGFPAPDSLRKGIRDGVKPGESVPRVYYYHNSTAGVGGFIAYGTTMPKLGDVVHEVGKGSITSKVEIPKAKPKEEPKKDNSSEH